MRRLACLALLAASAAAEPVVVDAATGVTLEGTKSVRKGDVLFVYCRGYDLARVTGRPARVALQPAADICTLRAPVALQVVVMLEAKEVPSLTDAYISRAREGVVLPRGFSARLAITAKHEVVWPASLVVEAGKAYTIHREQPRKVTVRVGRPVRMDEAEFLPDMRIGSNIDPGRADAWRLHINRSSWLQSSFFAANPTMHVLPDIPCHFFARVGDVPVYRRVGDVLDLRNPAPPRAVPEVRINGEPAREGTILAPGRLHLLALGALQDLAVPLRGCSHRVRVGVAARLPPADWLTAWHPDVGLAHVKWGAGPLVAKTYEGGIVLRMPRNGAQGSIAVYPVWKGTGTVQTVPPIKNLRWKFKGRKPLRIRGLPFGRYGVVLTAVRPEGVDRTFEIDVAGVRRLSVTGP